MSWLVRLMPHLDESVAFYEWDFEKKFDEHDEEVRQRPLLYSCVPRAAVLRMRQRRT